MITGRRILLPLGVLCLLALVVRPPYFVIDRASGGRAHASIGYHWIWSPPSAADGYRRLVGASPLDVTPERLAQYAVRLNTVRLVQSLVVLAAALALGAFLGRRRGVAGGPRAP